jgi:DNA-binding transcriptional LysR family regulator
LNLPSEETVRRLADGLIDFAFVRKDAVSKPLQAHSLGAMKYSLFVPVALRPGSRKDGLGILDKLPLATLEGEGSFRNALASAARSQQIRLDIQVECSSFPLAARAVASGKVAAILPSIAAAELNGTGTAQVSVSLLRNFEREMCLATSPRLIRIRPVLEKVSTALREICRF